ncbi:Caspase-2 [Nymphon striatum]|nr:Caspase-2 [Nymphon striatum]
MDPRLKDLLTENTVLIVHKLQYSEFMKYLMDREVLPKHAVEIIFQGWINNVERIQMMLIELKKSANFDAYRRFILALTDAGHHEVVKALQPTFSDGQGFNSIGLESNNNQMANGPAPPQIFYSNQLGQLIQPAIYHHVPVNGIHSSPFQQNGSNSPQAQPNGLNSAELPSNSTTPGLLHTRESSLSPNNSQNDAMEVDSSQSSNGTVAEYSVVQQVELQVATEFIINSENYKMTSKTKGNCLILNNVDFKDGPTKLELMETRHGSDSDANLLSQLFKKLGYEVHLHKNVTARGAGGMKELVKYFATKLDHSSVDSAVIIILSHGKSGDLIYGTDAETISMESILRYFNNENCPGLLGKPKMFFVQACRGDQVDRGVANDNVHDSPAGPEVHTVSLTRNDSMEDRIPRHATWSDMMIAYSTCPGEITCILIGYVSIRNTTLGSWFCQALVKIFMTRAHNTHLQDMMNLVSSEILVHYATYCGEKQAVEIVLRSWIKKLHFNPGCYRK